MTDETLKSLLAHLEAEWAVVAITADEVAELRALGLATAPGEPLVLTEAGHAKLRELRDGPEPDGPMYQVLADAGSVHALIAEMGGEAFERALKDEIRAAMTEHGNRVALWYGERLDNVNAVLGEFSV